MQVALRVCTAYMFGDLTLRLGFTFLTVVARLVPQVRDIGVSSRPLVAWLNVQLHFPYFTGM